MFSKQKEKKKKLIRFKKGISLIESLVLIFVFSISVLAFYSVFSVGIKYITNSKNKVVAVSLVNERMELLRNLGYDDVAIQGGIPSGNIDPDEYITIGDKTFHLITDVRYYDDPEDGTFGGSLDDTVPNDYKTVTITAKWGAEGDGEKTSLVSRFVPAGVESSAGGGVLSLNAIDFSGSPVATVSVNVYNDQVNPVVNYSTQTDSNGNLLLQGVPMDIAQNYQITFSKNNYDTVTTYSPVTAGFIPEYPHIAVMEGVLNERTMRIDLLSSLSVNSVDVFGEVVGSTDFDLIGGSRLDDGTGTAVYKYNDSHTTNASGDFSISDIISGEYTLTLGSIIGADYTFWKIDPGSDTSNQVLNLSPGDSLSTQIILMDNLIDSAFVKVADSITGAVIENASVRLKSDSLMYDVTLTTDKYGSVYFPESVTASLQNGELYDLEISATDFQDNITDITISGLTIKEVNLIAI